MIRSLIAGILAALFLLASCTQPSVETPVPGLDEAPAEETETPAPTKTPETQPTKPTSEPELLKVVGQIGGSTQAVAIQEDYAYIGTGVRLEIVDVSNPASGLIVGATEPLEGEVRDIVVNGDFAYVAAAGGGLNIINLSDPAQATVQGGYDTLGYTESVTVAEHYAYLADGPNGLSIVDISNPAEPIEIGTAYELNYVFDVAIAGHFAYLAATGAGLLVVDVSNPAQPVELGSHDTPGYAYGVTASGTSLYIADGWEGLQVFDISNPAQPKFMETYNTTGWAMDIAAVDAKLYVADAFGGLHIVDITNAAKPTELGSYRVPDGHAQSLAISGSIAYVADIYHGVHIVDVSIPNQPQRVALYSPMGYAHAVAVSDSYAYVASETYGFRVIDLAAPAKPREVNVLATDGPANTVAMSGNTAYVGTFTGGSPPYSMYNVDISDPLHPEVTSITPLAGYKGNQTFEGRDIFPEQDVCGMALRSLCIQGNTLYVPGEWGLFLLDVSDPLTPSELGFLQTTPSPSEKIATATGVAVYGSTAYLAVQWGGLYIIDVSDPTWPSLLGVFNEPMMIDSKANKNPKGVGVSDVVVAPPFAYILDQNFLRVLDVSDPSCSKSLASFPLPVTPFNDYGGAARSLAIDGDMLFVADGAAGLLLVDVTNPADPQLAEHLHLPGQASWVTLDGNYVYVADGKSGLYVIERVQNAAPAEVTSTSHNVSTTVIDPMSLSASSGLPFQYKPPGLNTNNSTLANMSIAEQPQFGDISNSVVFANTSGVTGDFASTTLVVTSTEDSGSGTLREAINKARSGDTIVFDTTIFPPESPATIYLTSGLSLSQGAITIDGSNAGVILNGSHAPKGTLGFNILSNDNVIKGLQILYFYGGILLSGNNNTIGGDRTHGNGPMGEGNLISNNVSGEIGAKLGSSNLIIGNYIGTDISGRNKLGNPQYWTLSLEGGSSNNRIENNVIAGSIIFIDSGTRYNEVVGNYIGTDVTGTITFEGEMHIMVTQPFNRIGGTRLGEGNVINGRVSIVGTSDVLLLGNFIGTDATGKKAFGIPGWVVDLEDGSRHNFIGGTTTDERNIINSSKDSTLVHLGGFANYNFIVGNYLGLDASGSVTMPNWIGISLEAAEHNIIQGNFISGSQTALNLASFDWDNPGASFNCLRANSITQSANLGIAVGRAKFNQIISNSLISNCRNGYDGGKDNSWDDGKGGNYWDDYTGMDKNGDGIGDIPYSISPNGVDNHPLMRPYQENI